MNNELNSVAKLALSKVIADKDGKIARGGVNPGTHNVDMTVRISGKMTVGEDYDTAPTVSIPLLETMAFLIRRMGVTRAAAVTMIRESMAEAIADGGKGKGALESEIVNEAMAIVQNDIIATLPRQPRKGVVKTYLAVETMAAVTTLA